MGIIGNKTILHKLPLTQVGGLFASDIATNPNWHIKENAKPTASVPNGYYAGGAWILPQKSGEIANINGIIGENLFIPNLAGGLNAESSIIGVGNITNAELLGLAFLISSLSQTSTLAASISGSVSIAADLTSNGDLEGSLGALVGIVADLNGQGELNADIAGAVQIIANLSANSNLSAAIKATVDLVATINGNNTLTSDIIGNWNMVTSLIGSDTFSGAIKAFAEIQANPQGSNTLILNNGAVPASMSSSITSLSELSPESLASAVWGALASQYGDTGTFGEMYSKILEISQSGAGSLTPESIRIEMDTNSVKLLDIQTKTGELHKVGGLDPLNPATTTQSEITVGDIKIDISGNGETITTFTRND